MRSFIAKVEIEMCIVAEDQKEAAEIAAKHFEEEIKAAPISELDFTIHTMDYIPRTYEDDTLVWNSLNKDITALEAVKMNCENYPYVR